MSKVEGRDGELLLLLQEILPDTQEADVDQIQMKRTEAKICLYSDSDSYGHEATL